MPKRLVICCDGTWNTPDQSRAGHATPTNVTKVALAVAAEGADGLQQCLYYHPGVGVRRWERLRGGAFGFGLSRDVRDTYRFVVENFEPGDELFFFGFSRGAFTARSTVGFIRNSGVLRREHADLVDKAYALYRDRIVRPRDLEAQLFRRSYSHETRIRFIGVWDTVGALGIPLSGLRWFNAFNRRWQFHDTELSTTVDAAFQALAVDERRGPFRPAVWKPQKEAVGQRVEQVWFAGVHCDVGGGYTESGLSDIALLWMVERARSCGLAFGHGAFDGEPRRVTSDGPGAAIPVSPDPVGVLHDSRTAFYRLVSPYDRPIGHDDPGHESVASTVVARHTERADYAPPGLLDYLRGPHRITDVGPTLPSGAGVPAAREQQPELGTVKARPPRGPGR